MARGRATRQENAMSRARGVNQIIFRKLEFTHFADTQSPAARSQVATEGSRTLQDPFLPNRSVSVMLPGATGTHP